MPSPTHQRLEYALLLTLGGSILLDRFAPSDSLTLLSPSQYNALRHGVVAVGVILLFAHHWRREMLPAYVAVLLRLATHVALPSINSPLISLWLERLSIGGVFLGAFFAYVFPLPDLSVLHGKYQTIGCRTARYGGVECRAFYPSAAAPSAVPPTQRIKYLHHGQHLAKGINVFSKVPEWFFNNLHNAYLAAIKDAPLAKPEHANGWPLVIFSHGLGGSIEMYSFINQQLASAGNIVVVVSHGDGSASVTQPESGRIEYYQQITDAVRHNIDGEGFRFRNSQLRHRVQEVRRVLNTVSALAKSPEVNDPIWAHVDLQNIHVAGHSFGGATALSAAHLDERFRTAVLLDVWMEPVDKDACQGMGSRTPVLHLLSEHFSTWQENAVDVRTHAHGCTHAKSRLKVVAGSRHNNFSDLPLFSPIINRIVKSSGSIDPQYALQLIGQLSAAFIAGEYDAAAEEFPEVVDMP